MRPHRGARDPSGLVQGAAVAEDRTAGRRVSATCLLGPASIASCRTGNGAGAAGVHLREVHLVPRGRVECYAEYRSEVARRYFGAGRQEGRLGEVRALLLALVARRLGEVPVGVRARIDACADIEELERLVVEVGATPDLTAVRQLFALE